MTTKIIINAICTSDKEVIVIIKDEGEQIDKIAIQNGNTESFYIYDERELKVKEQEKE